MNVKQQTKPNCTTSRVSGFLPAGAYSFYINSPFIKVIDQLVTCGHDYLLLYFNLDGQIQLQSVKFLNAHAEDGNVFLKLKNNRNGDIRIISISMVPENDSNFPFVLIDIHTLAIELNDPMADYEHQIARIKAFQDKTVCWNDVLKIIREEAADLVRKEELLDFDY